MNVKGLIRSKCIKLSMISMVLFSLSVSGGSLGTKEHIKYFEVVTGYSAPVVPHGEITYQEALKRRTYYEIIYNNQLKIKTVQKYLDGKPDFKYEYSYDKKGMISSWITINAEGMRRQVLP